MSEGICRKCGVEGCGGKNCIITFDELHELGKQYVEEEVAKFRQTLDQFLDNPDQKQ